MIVPMARTKRMQTTFRLENENVMLSTSRFLLRGGG
jgi:hypothetical protein